MDRKSLIYMCVVGASLVFGCVGGMNSDSPAGVDNTTNYGVPPTVEVGRFIYVKTTATRKEGYETDIYFNHKVEEIHGSWVHCSYYSSPTTADNAIWINLATATYVYCYDEWGKT